MHYEPVLARVAPNRIGSISKEREPVRRDDMRPRSVRRAEAKAARKAEKKARKAVVASDEIMKDIARVMAPVFGEMTSQVVQPESPRDLSAWAAAAEEIMADIKAQRDRFTADMLFHGVIAEPTLDGAVLSPVTGEGLRRLFNEREG